MYVSSFHFVSPCFITSIFQMFGLFHLVSEFFLYILFISFVLKQKWVYKKKKDVCFIVSFCFTLFRNEHISIFLGFFILFQRFSSISYSFHLLRNRNGFIKKDVCFIVLFRFTLFRNEHISNFLVCFILFQSFSYISYLFHLLRNINGIIKEKKWCMFHHFISFHPVS